jgi:AraC family transcriptional regulator
VKPPLREATTLFVIAVALTVASAPKGQEMTAEPQIIERGQTKLIGMSHEMSRVNDKTAQLWRGFMERRHEITDRSDRNFISMQVFPDGPSQLSDPAAAFAKWAVVEVESLDSVPQGMNSYVLQPGTYAVFIHNGPASDLSTFMYVFNEWLPNSTTYELDDREHFEVLPPDYDAQDPHAREEIWIPVKLRD